MYTASLTDNEIDCPPRPAAASVYLCTLNRGSRIPANACRMVTITQKGGGVRTGLAVSEYSLQKL